MGIKNNKERNSMKGLDRKSLNISKTKTPQKNEVGNNRYFDQSPKKNKGGPPVKAPNSAPPAFEKKGKPGKDENNKGPKKQLQKVDNKSVSIKKDKPQQKQQNNQQKVNKNKKNKNRRMRINQKMDTRERSSKDCKAAAKLEKDLTTQKGRVFTVKIQDPVLNLDVIKSWNTNIETAVFNRSMEPRQFLIVLKPEAQVQKVIEGIKKTKFADKNLIVEEKVDMDSGEKVDLIDPYTLYLTNLPEDTNREKLKDIFSKANNIFNPRKHNPKLGAHGKYSFITFDTTDDAADAFKNNFNKVIENKSIVMRYRRVGHQEKKGLKEDAESPAAAANNNKVANKEVAAVTPKLKNEKAAAKQNKTNSAKSDKTPQVGKKTPQMSKAVKKEPESDEDDEDDDEDVEGSSDDQDDGMDLSLAVNAEDEDEDDEDDDDDDDDDDEDEEDDDDDDDEDDDE